MRSFRHLRYRLRAILRRDAIDRELDDELAAWIAALTARYERRGWTRGAARTRALADLGRLERVRDDMRSAQPTRQLEGFMQDLKYAWRSLVRTPAFTLAVILTFALGIGANTAIFSVVNAMLIAPLPYQDSSQLVFVWSDMTAAGYPRAPLSAPELTDLRTRSTRFAGFGAIWANTTTLTDRGEPEQLRIGLVTSDFFGVLGASAAIGRTFQSSDDTDGPGILLSWPLFQRRFGGDRSIVGTRIQANGQSVTVIGIMPADFRLLMPTDAAVPDDLQAWQLLRAAGLARAPRGQQYLRVVGRMKPGVPLAAARADVTSIAAAISREFVEYGADGRQFTVVGLQADGVREIRPALLALFAGVGLLLVVACVNVTNLLLARAAARDQETGLRLTLGAGRWRLARQCLAEGLVVAALGAAAGMFVGWLGLRGLLLLRPAGLQRLGLAHVDTTVLAFTCAAACFWGLACSLAPLRSLLRTNVLQVLRRDGQRVARVLHRRTRASLAVLQVALGVVLLVGAGLMVRTVVNIQRIDPGFTADGILTFRLSVPFSRYRSREAANAFGQQFRETLAATPGVSGVGAISHLPYDDVPNWGGQYVVAPDADRTKAPNADYRVVTPGFFEEVGATLIEGRFIAVEDVASAAPVVVVDDLLARRAWPGQSALGRSLIVDPGSSGVPTVPVTVVGVVRHLRLRSLVEDLTEQVYFSAEQVPRNPLAYVVKTTGDPAALVGPIRAELARLDPLTPIYDVRPFSTYVREAAAGRRFTMTLAACFAGVATLLASVGVYGVMAYSVTRRRREFGVRLALGAMPRQVAGAVLGEGAVLAAIGIAIGVVGARAAAQALRHQFFGVTPSDPLTYALVIPALGLVLILACWLPARRATSGTPMDALNDA